MKRSESYQKHLIEDLRDPLEALAYLNAALEGGDKDVFLLAPRNVAEAHGGLLKLARRTKLDRTNLYRILSKNGNPEIQSLETILEAMDMRLAVVSLKAKTRKAA